MVAVVGQLQYDIKQVRQRCQGLSDKLLELWRSVMECDEKAENKRSKIRGTQSSEENNPAKRKQSKRIGSQSRLAWDDSCRFDRSDWGGRNPFGFIGGEVINQLIESIQADIEESREIVSHHSQKVKRLLKQLENLKNLQSLQNEATEEAELEQPQTEEE
ncbi:MAG: hypothetical protein WBA13_14300 [Microcoleaceae cyanobacterium]